MKKNLSIVRLMLAAIVFSTCAPSLKAQSGVVVNVGADLVSGYVWRGVYQIGSGASVQPSLGLAYKGFSIGAWGSTSLREGFKELDLSAGYSVGGFSVGVTDYWWAGQGAPFYSDYLNTHLFEGTLGYHFGKKFPLHVSWSTMFAGNLDKVDGERSFRPISNSVTISGSKASIDLCSRRGAVGRSGMADSAMGRQRVSGFEYFAESLQNDPDYGFLFAAGLRAGVASPATDDASLVFGISF